MIPVSDLPSFWHRVSAQYKNVLKKVEYIIFGILENVSLFLP